MFSRLMLKYRVRQAQKRYGQLSYDIRPRVQATALANMIQAKWVKETYTTAKAHSLLLRVRSSDPSKLVHGLAKVLEIMQKREVIDVRYKLEAQPRNVTLDAWLEDKDRREISPYVVAKELKRLIPAVSKEIAECELSREDLYEYYQLNTLAYMEDATEFLEAIVSLKLTK